MSASTAGSAQSPMIRIPNKETEEVDLASHVSKLIQNSYGESPSSFSEQLTTLNRARQDAVRGAGSEATARDLLFKWFHMLEMLELRFPELRIPTPWKDAFTKKTISQSSLAYEKACVIFEIAATLSSLASNQTRLAGNPDGLKRAYLSYRQAAGMLSYINENFLHAPSTDMSKDVVKCLTTVMLAQASEVFWEKVVEEKKANSLVAKIASHTMSTYQQAVEGMKEWTQKAVMDRQWLALLQTKQQYFASLTQYYRALADDAANSHGTCLVRLIYAETLAKEAVQLANVFHSTASGYLSSTYLPSDATTSMQALTKAHLAQCTERKVQAQKDNDLIYHDILPSESSLPAVEKLVAATPMTIQEVYATPEVEKVVSPDLFHRLVPLQVHESASLYSEEKAKLARAESERQDLANGELEAALSYMGLPAALSMFKNLGQANGGLDSLADPPAEVVRWAEEENSASSSQGLGSGAQGVDAAFRRLEQMKTQASQQISSTIALLDDENRECEKARVKWGHEWTQDPSGLHTKVMRSDLKSNKDALAAAGANDARVKELWESIKPDMMILTGGRPALERAFAEAITRSSAGAKAASLLDVDEEEDKLDDAQIAGMKGLVSEIDELVIKLNKIKRERATTLTDMKEKIQNDDISQVLVVNRRNQNMSSQIFAQELEKFKPYQSRIALCNSQQQQTLMEVTQKWKELTEGKLAQQLQKRFTETEASRRKLVERLRSARDSDAEVRATVSKGLTFYSDLLEIVAALRKNAESFVAERKSERDRLISAREWEDKLTGDAPSSNTYNPRTTSPPARGQSSLHDAMASMSMNSGPPPPPLPQQRQQFSSPPLQPTYSYAPPPAAPISSPYDMIFDKGPFGDRPAPQTSSPYAPPPPQQSYQSSYAGPRSPSYASPQSPSYASPKTSGVPPPPAQFQSSFQGSSSPYSAPPPPQSYHQYGGYSQPPPPPPPQQTQASGGYGYGGPPPRPPVPQGQYQTPPPQPQQGQSYQTSWQRPAY